MSAVVAKPIWLRPASAVPVSDRLHAKELAQLEGIAISTARSLINSQKIERPRGRNARDVWIDRHAYQVWLDNTAA